MSVQIVRFGADAERISEVEAAGPAGIDCTAARVGEGTEFLLTPRLTGAGADPLPGIPAAREFRTRITEWAGAQVPPQPLTVLAGYSR